MDTLNGIFDNDLRLGVVSAVGVSEVQVNLHHAGSLGGRLQDGARYGLGEVGEFVVIEAESVALLGRIVEVRLPERERPKVNVDTGGGVTAAAVGIVQLLGTVALESLKVTAGVSSYPRLGDRVYSAPNAFLSSIPLRLEKDDNLRRVALDIGRVGGMASTKVEITPERLLGRHCAVLGATGGGKSYTLSRIIEECLRYRAKLILIDATGEYRDFRDQTLNIFLGNPSQEPADSIKCSLPPSNFRESDFMALFQPSGKAQGPKLRSAIRSLRLISLRPELESKEKPGLLVRANRKKQEILDVERDEAVSRALDNPATPFDPFKLVDQIVEECVFETGGSRTAPDPTRWGEYDSTSLGYCMMLLTRINDILTSRALECVFGDDQGPSVVDQIEEFLESNRKLLRISLEGIGFEYSAREIISNALGRYLLYKAREGVFREQPIVVLVDEAHNFLGRSIGGEDSPLRLDAFELIAKEGRKYGLNLCLATQRPRDITGGVLSQMGTLVVHRLTNDRDREIVERASGEIDRSASSFLPALEPGEALIVGVDFPIPLTVKIHQPLTPPHSQGSDFQKHWGNHQQAGSSAQSEGNGTLASSPAS